MANMLGAVATAALLILLVLVGLPRSACAFEDRTTEESFDVFSEGRQYRLVAGLCEQARDLTAWVRVSGASKAPLGQWRRHVGTKTNGSGERYSRLCWETLPMNAESIARRACLAASMQNQLVVMSPKLDTRFLSANVFYDTDLVLNEGLGGATITTVTPSVSSESFLCGGKPVPGARAVVLIKDALTISTTALPDTAGVALSTSLDTRSRAVWDLPNHIRIM